ncbi:MAG: oligosaccharide flippase family protein [Alphaproteobacteria bacterium]|nr:oligosaccharide flippase family protein [Alphaproteobacteria bacterium]
MPSSERISQLGSVATNQVMREICVFLRNVIIARLMGAESLGEFIFLILSIRLLAMSTDLATERYILWVKRHEVRTALASAHLVVCGRGVFLAACLIGLGAFEANGISFSCYLLLAGSALLRGFTHQGYRLKQRTLNFRPALYVEASTTVLATIALYVAATMAPVLEVVCSVLLLQSGMHTALSHILSDAPYEANFNKQQLGKMLGFGWPLMLSGVTMFWSMQGERVILSAILDAEDFAHFSMLFQLALVPVLVVARIALTTGLPLLANSKNSAEAFEERLEKLSVATHGVSALFCIGFVLMANPTLVTLFGAPFEAETGLVMLVALAQAIRLCRTPQSVAAQALGHTDIPFKANLVRVSAVLVAVALLPFGGSLQLLLFVACAGEAAAWITQAMLYSLRTRRAPVCHKLKTQEQLS